ncbi:MAG: c-type cytochrome [Gammaproteobacteria bacterium]|nr:c-type cytochrome [Gammaproteobacteria bacterium]
MKCSVLNIVVPLVLTSTLAQAADSDPEEGKTHFGVCQGCHGAAGQGNQESGAPSVSGQNSWYLIRQLENFRDGIRGAHDDDTYGQLMASMAKTLPDAQAVKNVTAYIATLTPVSSSPTEAVGNVAQGSIIFSSCQTCHGERGEGSEALGGPRLAGQHDWYLIRQLKNFKAGVRGVHEKDTYGQTMRSMAHALLADDQALKDVVTFIKTLP